MLHFAAEGGHVDCVKLLLEANATPHHCWNDKGRVSPLLLAAFRGHDAVVELLAPRVSKTGLDMQHSKALTTPLTAAVFGQQTKTVQAVRIRC